MTKKVVIIGIDGMDPILLETWKNELGVCGSLFENRSEISIESTFPPDSICAWTSIFTGMNPAEHGLLESIDYLSSKKSQLNEDKTLFFKGKTFWDLASAQGKTVCIINPFLAYPSWSVNGSMISGPVFEGGNLSASPELVLSKYDFPSLGGIVDFPDERELESFFKKTEENTRQLADVSLKMFKDQAPDLFFVSFLTLDRVKHFLWRYTDPMDPFYPGENKFETSIKKFYLLFDKIIGDFIKSLSIDSTLLVISDHGHRQRCTQCLNINEFLRTKGYIKMSGKGLKGFAKKYIEKLKVFTVSTMARFGLQDYMHKVAKFIPNRRSLKKSTYLIEQEKSLVKLSNMCGVNPYGGIDIKKTGNIEYEVLRDNVIKDLMSLNKLFGKNVIKWAVKREEIYTGKNQDKFPDILFELSDEYGVGENFFVPLVTPNYTHKKISGGHKREAVFAVFSKNSDIKKVEKPKSIIGIYDYILKLMGISDENPSN